MVLIPFSRVYLGVHSVNQIAIGALISLNLILWTSEEKAEELLENCKLNPRLTRAISFLGVLLCTLIIGGSMLHNRHKGNDAEWKHWEGCRECEEDLFSKSHSQSAGMFLPFGILLGISFNLRVNFPKGLVDTKEQDCKFHFKRVIIFLIASLPASLLMGLAFALRMAIHEHIPTWYFFSYLIIFSLVAYIIGVFFIFYAPMLFAVYGVASKKDFYNTKILNINESTFSNIDVCETLSDDSY